MGMAPVVRPQGHRRLVPGQRRRRRSLQPPRARDEAEGGRLEAHCRAHGQDTGAGVAAVGAGEGVRAVAEERDAQAD